jgi:hypothetical protein
VQEAPRASDGTDAGISLEGRAVTWRVWTCGVHSIPTLVIQQCQLEIQALRMHLLCLGEDTSLPT